MSDGRERKRNGEYIRRRREELTGLDKGNIFSLVPPKVNYNIIAISVNDTPEAIPSNALLNVVRGDAGDLVLCHGRKELLRIMPDSAQYMREQFGDRGLQSVIGKVIDGPNESGFYQVRIAPVRKDIQ